MLVFGLGLWLELVGSPPLVPRSGHLRRAVLAALVMWAFWILAYVIGLSTTASTATFHHAAGGLSAAADQQIASAVLWFVAAVAFVPVDLLERPAVAADREDPDAELLALTRAERRRGTPPLSGSHGGAAAGLAEAQPVARSADEGGQVDRLQVGVEVAVGRLLLGQGACRRSAASWDSCFREVRAAPPRRRVVHQRLDVLDRPQGVRRGPQRRRRHHLAQLLAGRGSGHLDVGQVVDALVGERAGRLVVAQQARRRGPVRRRELVGGLEVPDPDRLVDG